MALRVRSKVLKWRVVLLYSEIMRMRIIQSIVMRSHKVRLQLRLGTLAPMLAVAMAACSTGQTSPGMAPGDDTGRHDGGSNSSGGRNTGDGGSGDSGTVSGTCKIGDSKACRVVLGIYKGQESCFVGMQYCDTGTWTSCIDKRDAN